MKKSFFQTAIVLATLTMLTANRSFADQKNFKGGGFSKNGGQSRSVGSVSGNNFSKGSSVSSARGFSGRGMASSPTIAGPQKTVNVSGKGTSIKPATTTIGSLNGNKPAGRVPGKPTLIGQTPSKIPGLKPSTGLPSIGKPSIGKPSIGKPSGGQLSGANPPGLKLPGTQLPGLQAPGAGKGGIQLPSKPNQSSTKPGQQLLQLGNGKTAKPIALNPALVLKGKSQQALVKPQILKIVAAAPQHLCVRPHFHWWVSVCYTHCHTNYGCWNIHNQYWDCWTPCDWNVVQCQQTSWFVGMSCTYIPDMQAYGVQSVVDGSPAHQAALAPGDLILSVNGQTVVDPQLVNEQLVHGRLDLVVVREGLEAPAATTIFPQVVTVSNF